MYTLQPTQSYVPLTSLNTYGVVMESRKKNLDVKGPRTSKMVYIDVTDVSKTKPRCLKLVLAVSKSFLLLAPVAAVG